MTAPCSKCISNVCDFSCICKCHKPHHDCIRCGDPAPFKVKYRNVPQGITQWVKTWLCIDCKGDFK